jgi:murein L,D-transpeptidase YcbB/YkuD
MSTATSSFFHSAAALQEVETFSKPGTADVTAGDLKKLSPLLAHYKGMVHPFTECKKDQLKHGLSEEHANRRCAVIKDLNEGTTKWRGKAKEEAEEILGEALELLQVAGSELGGPLFSRLLQEDGLIHDAAVLVEAAPNWMIPVAAKSPGFRPTSPEKRTGSSNSEFNNKHPRGAGTQGGQFISKGTTGHEVTAVQQRLGLTRTGTFDGQTKRRVERFQKNHGLQVDGVVGQQTVAAFRGTTTGVAPGALGKNDRRYLRRYARRH